MRRTFNIYVGGWGLDFSSQISVGVEAGLKMGL
jgi:hypothetical protein